MIQGENIVKYENQNKIYIPSEYNNENYKYIMNNNTITIITNIACENNYNSTYCNCYQFNSEQNIVSSVYSCNRNQTTGVIPYNTISSDINNSMRANRDFTSNYIILIGIVIIAILLMNTLKRNSRKI